MSIKGFEVGGVQAKYDYESLDNIPANLVQDANYVHTDNNYTNADKTKLSGIEAQANKTTIDATLTHSGQAADAKATGDAISALDAQVIASMPHDTASGSIASFPDGAAMPVRDCSVAIEPVQSGSGDPSPDNVRPISGFTGLNVYGTGVNVWDEETVGGVLNSNGTVTVSDARLVTSYIPIKPGETYCVAIPYNVRGRSAFYDASKAFLSYYGDCPVANTPSVFPNNGSISGSAGAYYFTFIAPQNAFYFRYNIVSSYGATYHNDISINYPSTDTDYHAYVGTTLPVSWQSEAGTVYGGTLDVTTGKLTVDRAIVDLGTLNWAKGSIDAAGAVYHTRWYNNTVSNMGGAVDTANGICSHYTVVPYTGTSSDVNVLLNGKRDNVASSEYRGYIQIVDSAKDNLTAEEFKAAMSGVMFVYVLSTTIEVQLTPAEITTLLGTNNIFADCGDTTVSYYADTTLFVNKKIAAAVAALS